MPVRDGRTTTLSPFCPTIEPGHLGRCPCLIDKHQPIGVEIKLTRKPGLPTGQHIRPLLFGGVRLFLNVTP